MTNHQIIYTQEIRDLLETIVDKLTDQARIDATPADVRAREWWTEADACARKGVSHSVLRRPENRRYLPNHGMPARVMRNGRYSKMYHWTWVAEWLPLTEAEIEQTLSAGEWLGRVDATGNQTLLDPSRPV